MDTADAAQEYREKGNAFLKAKDYTRAVELYSRAIDLEVRNRVLYSNRSRAYLRLERYEDAQLDARICIDMDPKWPNGWWRLSKALLEEGKSKEAKRVIGEALGYCPGNKNLLAAAHDIQTLESTKLKQ